MTNEQLVAVLGSAFLHALWNIFAKRTPYKRAFIWWITAWGTLFLLPLVFFIERPVWDPSQMLFPGLSVVTHAAYSLCLAEAYRRLPFTVSYPLSRGMAQIFIVLSGLFLFHESPAPIALVGVLAVILGLQLMAMAQAGSFLLGFKQLGASPWPWLVAICIACYTSIDHRSVQVLPPLTVCFVSNLGQLLLLYPLQRSERIENWRSFLGITGIMGIVSTVGYCLFLWAQHTGGLVSLVAPLRESSILMGVCLSALLLKEQVGYRKVLAASVMVFGIVLIRMG